MTNARSTEPAAPALIAPPDVRREMAVCLDLFCGAGGSARGLQQAGFYVVGVDHKPQPRYAGDEFVLGDALEFCAEHGQEYDMINASPPCDPYTRSRPMWPATEVPELIAPTREALMVADKPWVIENVVGAPLRNPIKLCGLMFGLRVFRHRLFESNISLVQPPHPSHNGHRIGVGGFCCVCGHGDAGRGKIDKVHRRLATWQLAMGIDWMQKNEIVEAIPPAYLHYIGTQMMRRM